MRRISFSGVIYCSLLIVSVCACNLASSTATTPEPTRTVQAVIALATMEATQAPTLQVQIPAEPTATPTTRETTSSLAQMNNPCTPQTAWQKYVVASGDTLNSIAQRAGLTAQALATANCLSNPNLITVGQIIYVPGSTAPRPADTQARIGRLSIASRGVNPSDQKYHMPPNSSVIFHVDGINSLSRVEILASTNNGRATEIIGTINNPQASADVMYTVALRAGFDLQVLANGFGKSGEVLQTNLVVIALDGDSVGFQMGALSVAPATIRYTNPNDLIVAPNTTVTLTQMVHDAASVAFFSALSPADLASSRRTMIGMVNQAQNTDQVQIQFVVSGAVGSVVYIQAEAYSVFASAVSAQSQVVQITVQGAAPSPIPSQVPPPTYTTYTNTKYGYSFQYPQKYSFTGNSGSDYVVLADQISVQVTTFDPQQARGDGPVIQSTEQITVGNLSATRLKGYYGSVGGGTPQSYESIVFSQKGYFYIFTVTELKNGVVLPADRQPGPIPGDVLALFQQVVATVQF